jgi:hypothetical protein
MARASAVPLKTHYIYWGAGIRLSYATAPPIFAMPFSIDADVEIPATGANGVVLAAGSMFGGWSFYLKDGKPVAYASATQLPGQQFRVAASRSLSAGPNKLRFEFTAQGNGGVMTIFLNGEEVAHGGIAHPPATMAGIGETLDIGRDSNVPVSDEYENEGVFTGRIKKVQIDVKPQAAPATASSSSRYPVDPDD